jgi:hypothetical protein
MATTGLTERHTIKPLLNLLYVLAVLALIEALHASYYSAYQFTTWS